MSKIKLLISTFWAMFRQIKSLKTYSRSIVLRSMQKSGTNYLRLILTNYFYNLDKIKKDNHEYIEVDYDRMHFESFPNIRHMVFDGKSDYTAPQVNIYDKEKYKYSDFMYDHFCILDESPFSAFVKPKKMIMIYRNPLDVLISRYYFYYKNRENSDQTYKHPRELINEYIPNYIHIYKWMKQYSSENPNTILITYEELKLFPEETITSVLNHLNITVDQELIRFSLMASSIDKVKETEKKRGFAIHSSSSGAALKGSFARSGSIGQWKNYFEDTDIDKIKALLAANNLNLNEFTINPPPDKAN
ncbi:MAG: sulfotransferase domain-containing protein [Flavobacteriales bacterium]|nr:sulfotransferase domain-containing protein [Flavobacteriales bacterium]